MASKIKVTRGSGNVFYDIGFSKTEAENLMLRAQLMTAITQRARKLTQTRSAKLFGVTQPRMNDLLRGKIGKFSLDALVKMLANAGMRVEMRVRAA